MKPSFYIRYYIVRKLGGIAFGSLPLNHKGNALYRNGKFGLTEKKKVCRSIGMKRGDRLKEFEIRLVRTK